MRKKQWSDLSSRQRAGLVGAGIVQVSLQLATLVDLYRRPREQVKGHKAAWVAASFVNTFGPLAYFEYGRRR